MCVSVCRCSRRIVKHCLRQGISPDVRNNAGETVVHTMAGRRPYAKQLELIEYMAHHGCDMELRDNQGRTALFNAAATGRTDILGSLYDMEADVSGRAVLVVLSCDGCCCERVVTVFCGCVGVCAD